MRLRLSGLPSFCVGLVGQLTDRLIDWLIVCLVAGLFYYVIDRNSGWCCTWLAADSPKPSLRWDPTISGVRFIMIFYGFPLMFFLAPLLANLGLSVFRFWNGMFVPPFWLRNFVVGDVDWKGQHRARRYSKFDAILLFVSLIDWLIARWLIDYLFSVVRIDWWWSENRSIWRRGAQVLVPLLVPERQVSNASEKPRAGSTWSGVHAASMHAFRVRACAYT